jgi:hypothetical protein
VSAARTARDSPRLFLRNDHDAIGCARDRGCSYLRRVAVVVDAELLGAFDLVTTSIFWSSAAVFAPTAPASSTIAVSTHLFFTTCSFAIGSLVDT